MFHPSVERRRALSTACGTYFVSVIASLTYANVESSVSMVHWPPSGPRSSGGLSQPHAGAPAAARPTPTGQSSAKTPSATLTPREKRWDPRS